MPCDRRLRLEFDIIVTHRTLVSSVLPSLVLSSMSSCMPVPVEVRNIVMVSKGVVAWSHASMRRRLMTKRISPWVLLRIMRCAPLMRRCATTTTTGAFLMRFLAFVSLIPPSSATIETRWRAAKGAPSATQA